LEEVIFNLVHNAIEAMDATIDRARVLRVRLNLTIAKQLPCQCKTLDQELIQKQSTGYLVHFLLQSRMAWALD
jgi:hypothetical protein